MPKEGAPNATDFEGSPLSRQEYISSIIHLYRGEMHRALTWRQRLDTTTNWAVFTAGALLSFLFTNQSGETHVVGILGILLVFFMLCFEGRRFRYFDVWRGRVRKLEENFYAPMLRRDLSSPVENWGFVVAQDLLTPRFKISYLTAVRARLIRNYVPIFLVLFCAWFAKLILNPPKLKLSDPVWAANHPDGHETTFGGAIENAKVGPIAWWLVFGGVCALGVFLLYVGLWCGPKHSKETTWWSNRSDESVDEIS
ncbi:MAG: hypothetical protein CL908_13890 [Deltaproteobacteria bacterium]|nr:hypothetical protein [Deltaproteobacteria bacterium]